MRTIRIFLASSITELAEDRDKFGEFIRSLEDIYEKRNIRIKLVRCEDLEKEYLGRPTQDVLNEKLKKCELFVALFYKSAGDKTLEEFEIALHHFKKKGIPKIVVFMKDVDENQVSTKLKQFRAKLNIDLGYYWARYDSMDKLHSEFLKWLPKVEFLDMNAIKIVNDRLTIDGLTIAQLLELPFVAKNDEFQNLCKDLLELPKEIDEISEELKNSGSKYLQKRLQQLKDLRNDKTEDLVRYLQSMQDMTKYISDQHQKQQTGRLKEAIDAFKADDWKTANVLLKTISREGEESFENYEQSRQKRHQYIEANRMLALTVMTELDKDIHDRINNAAKLYKTADDWARKSAYDDENYVQLLSDYASFLNSYSRFNESEQVYLRLIDKLEKLSVPKPIEMAMAYNGIASVYLRLKDVDKAKNYLEKALKIREDYPNEEQPETTASTYHHLGSVYFKKKDFDKALKFFNEAKVIREMNLGLYHAETATSYQKIGEVYFAKKDFKKHMPFLKDALAIRINLFGTDHPETAKSYDSIGQGYKFKRDYYNAFKYIMKALKIREKTLGKFHSMTAKSFDNVGEIHEKQGHLDKALNYYRSALTIREHVLSSTDVILGKTYQSIGRIYERENMIDEAIDNYLKAAEIYEKSSEMAPMDTNNLLIRIGNLYKMQNNIMAAIDSYFRALDVCKKYKGEDHVETAKLLQIIGKLYEGVDNDKALRLYKESISILENINGGISTEIVGLYNYIVRLYEICGDMKNAEVCAQKRKEVLLNLETAKNQESSVPKTRKRNDSSIIENEYTEDDYLQLIKKIKKAAEGHKPPVKVAKFYFRIAEIRCDHGDYNNVIKYCSEAISIYERYYRREYNELSLVYTLIGFAYRSLEDYDNALFYSVKALDIYRGFLNIDYPTNEKYARIISIRNNRIAEVYFLMDDYKNALEYNKKALMICEKILGEDHPTTWLSLVWTARDYEALGNYVEAQKLFNRNYIYNNKKYGPDDARTQKVKEDLNRVEEKLKSENSPE